MIFIVKEWKKTETRVLLAPVVSKKKKVPRVPICSPDYWSLLLGLGVCLSLRQLRKELSRTTCLHIGNLFIFILPRYTDGQPSLRLLLEDRIESHTGEAGEMA